jgi:predicted Zn-dependent protease
MERSMRSFEELTDESVLAVEPARLAVTEVGQSMQLAGVVEARPDVSVSPQTVAILNHLSLQDLIDAGDLVKLVVGGSGVGR